MTSQSKVLVHGSLAWLSVAALLFATSAWGSLFYVGKVMLEALDPVWFTVLRYALATMALLVLVQAFGRSPWSKLRDNMRRLTWMGIVGYGVFSVMVFVGLAHSVPSHGAVIIATMPLTTLLLRWVLDGVRPAGRSLLAAFVALLGVAIVSGALGDAGKAFGTTLSGDLITLTGTVAWVLYTRGAASLPDFSPLEYSALTAAASIPWLLLGGALATVAHATPPPSLDTVEALLPQMLYVAAVPTVCAVIAFNFGVKHLGAPSGTLFLCAVPVSVLVISAAMGTPPSGSELAGTGLVAAAIGLNASSFLRPNPARLADR